MKKKTVKLRKISLMKETIASLTQRQEHEVKGGNSMITTPCPGGLECATIQDTPSCKLQC